MAWERKRYQASPEFLRLRPRVLSEANYQCEIVENGERCTNRANEVDHKLNKARGGTDNRNNLQAICPVHHRRKSALEGVAGRKIQPRRRPLEEHPGYDLR